MMSNSEAGRGRDLVLPSGAVPVRLLFFVALAEQQAALRNFGLDLVLIIAMSDIFDFVDPMFVREVEAHVVALRNFSTAPACTFADGQFLPHNKGSMGLPSGRNQLECLIRKRDSMIV